MRSSGQAVSVTSTLKHKPSSGSRSVTPSTLVAQGSSHDLKGSYAEGDRVLINISGRQSPQSIGGLKNRVDAVRSETTRRKSPTPVHGSLTPTPKVSSSNQQLTGSSTEHRLPKERRRQQPASGTAKARQAGSSRASPVPKATAVRESKPLPAIFAAEPSPPPHAIFADFLSASPSSMASSQLPVYSSDEDLRARRRHQSRRGATRTPSFGSRRQGLWNVDQLYSDSSSSESDAESIAKSQDSTSTGHTGSTDYRSSRFVRLFEALGI